jgi:hypothetical protein
MTAARRHAAWCRRLFASDWRGEEGTLLALRRSEAKSAILALNSIVGTTNRSTPAMWAV